MSAVEVVSRQDMLARRVRLLVLAAISYNVIEAVVAVSAGVAASSTALLGFGLDSVIEVSSAAAVAWQFSARGHAGRQAREYVALRITSLSFFALAAFVAADSLRGLLSTDRPAHSLTGLILAASSLVIMPLLSAAQRGAGRQLGSASAVADSKQTLLCTYLSGVLLVGLLANLTFGWWWADPVAGLVIAVIAVAEGRAAWRGDGCCTSMGRTVLPSATGTATVGAAGCTCC